MKRGLSDTFIRSQKGIPTSIGPFMEFACNPLDRKLFKKKDSGAEEECEKNFRYNVNSISGTRRGLVGLVIIDEWLVGDPECKSPAEEGDISII